MLCLSVAGEIPRRHALPACFSRQRALLLAGGKVVNSSLLRPLQIESVEHVLGLLPPPASALELLCEKLLSCVPKFLGEQFLNGGPGALDRNALVGASFACHAAYAEATGAGRGRDPICEFC